MYTNRDKTSLRKRKRMQRMGLMMMELITFQLIHQYILLRLPLLMVHTLVPLHQDINMNPYLIKLKKKSRMTQLR